MKELTCTFKCDQIRHLLLNLHEEIFLFEQGGSDFDQPMAYRQIMGALGYVMDLTERSTEAVFVTNSWVQSPKRKATDTFQSKTKDGMHIFINCKQESVQDALWRE